MWAFDFHVSSFVKNMWHTFWCKDSTSASLLWYSKFNATDSVAVMIFIKGIFLSVGTNFSPKFMQSYRCYKCHCTISEKWL